MSLGIHKHILNHGTLPDTDVKMLVLVDMSQYMEPPEKPVYEITVPGFNKPAVVYYIPNQVSVINSNLLGLSCGDHNHFTDLPDGIYRITQRICPHESLFKYKAHLRTVQLENKFDVILQSLGHSDYSVMKDMTLKMEIINLDILINSAKAECRQGNETKAIAKYGLANKLADKLHKLIK